jgi:hypothetical protein
MWGGERMDAHGVNMLLNQRSVHHYIDDDSIEAERWTNLSLIYKHRAGNLPIRQVKRNIGSSTEQWSWFLLSVVFDVVPVGINAHSFYALDSLFTDKPHLYKALLYLKVSEMIGFLHTTSSVTYPCT